MLVTNFLIEYPFHNYYYVVYVLGRKIAFLTKIIAMTCSSQTLHTAKQSKLVWPVHVCCAFECGTCT